MQAVQLMRRSTHVSANDVVNGIREATLGLLWRVFLHFQVYAVLSAATACHPQAMLLLVNRQHALSHTSVVATCNSEQH